MAVSPARAVALEILLKVERENSYASDMLHSPRFAKLSLSDHGLATELVMGVLRWQGLLDRTLAVASSQKLEKLDREVLIALRLGVYQLQFLSRVPARAAIFESVELVKAARKKSAASFVNAILRKFRSRARVATGLSSQVLREDAFDSIRNAQDSRSLAHAASHPEWLVKRWADAYGLAVAKQICLYDQSPPATSIHIYDDRVLTELAEGGIELAPGHLLSSDRTVIAGDVAGTPACRQGRIAIQDEASQLVAMLVGHGEVDSRLLRRARRQDFDPGSPQSEFDRHCHGIASASRAPAALAGPCTEYSGGQRGRPPVAVFEGLRSHSGRRSVFRDWDARA